jgi:hypothetical protein
MAFFEFCRAPERELSNAPNITAKAEPIPRHYSLVWQIRQKKFKHMFNTRFLQYFECMIIIWRLCHRMWWRKWHNLPPGTLMLFWGTRLSPANQITVVFVKHSEPVTTSRNIGPLLGLPHSKLEWAQYGMLPGSKGCCYVVNCSIVFLSNLLWLTIMAFQWLLLYSIIRLTIFSVFMWTFSFLFLDFEFSELWNYWSEIGGQGRLHSITSIGSGIPRYIVFTISEFTLTLFGKQNCN